MNLAQALLEVPSDGGIGIWAELINGQFTEDSTARYGKTDIIYGGVKDGKKFVCPGNLPDYLQTVWSGHFGIITLMRDDPKFIEAMIKHINHYKV